MSKPLEGVKVVELAEYVAVPGAPRLLADWGATVYKVERPVGDPSRHLGPSFKMDDFDKLPYNHVVDMMVGGNREYVCLDLKNPDGMATFLKMLEGSDVFCTSWRQKALDKLGLDYETIHKKFPRLIYAQVTGYGDKGACKDFPGYDTICYAARGGWMRTLPQEGDAPMNWPNALGDLPVSATLASGICAALYKQKATGEGERVSVSLYHTALYFLTVGIVSSTYDNHYPSSRRNPPSPLNNTYPTKDGWVYLCMPVYDVEWNKCVDFLGRPDLKDSPHFLPYSKVREEGRVEEVVDLLETLFKQKTCDEWEQIFIEKDVPAGVCYTIDKILKDPQAWENNFLRTIEYGDGKERIVTDTPVRFDSMGLPEIRKCRPIGFDTDWVLKDFGYTEAQIADLQAKGAVVINKKWACEK